MSWRARIVLLAALAVAALCVARRGADAVRVLATSRGVEASVAEPESLATGRFEAGGAPAMAAAGIRLPDGTCLPPLNGVQPGDPIPPVQREPFMPPIGRVVGRWTDAGGDEWWITEDGSAFTTRWETVRLGDGSLARVVRLDQSDALDEVAFGRSLAATTR